MTDEKLPGGRLGGGVRWESPGGALAGGLRHEIPGDAAWSTPVRAGRALTLTALSDTTNATVLIVGPDRLDRLNIPDTLKSQMTARIHAPLVLMSDRGRALATVAHSTLDWHDCLTGFTPTRLLLLELIKHGLGEADLHGSINFFTKVEIDAAAKLTHVPHHATVGASVTLRAEQDLLVLVSTAPHPLATETGAVAAEIGTAEPGDPELRAEAVRALELVR